MPDDQQYSTHKKRTTSLLEMRFIGALGGHVEMIEGYSRSRDMSTAIYVQEKNEGKYAGIGRIENEGSDQGEFVGKERSDIHICESVSNRGRKL